MLGVGRFGGDDETEEDEPGGQDIAGGFNTVGYCGGGGGVETDGDFRGRETRADQHAGDGDPAAGEFGCHCAFPVTDASS